MELLEQENSDTIMLEQGTAPGDALLGTTLWAFMACYRANFTFTFVS